MLGSLLGPGEDVNRLKPDAYWPPARVELQLVTIRIISLHQLPKVRSPRLLPPLHSTRRRQTGARSRFEPLSALLHPPPPNTPASSHTRFRA
eukprot:3412974-Prymnesium_polylepis.1